MNKSEFVKKLANKGGMTIREAENTYEAFVEIITDEIKKGEKVQLTGFATFELKEKPAHEGINPLTKAKVKVPASKSPAIKFSKAYKDLFN